MGDSYPKFRLIIDVVMIGSEGLRMISIGAK